MFERFTERARRVIILAREEAGRPFDLGDSRGGPLLRAVLLRLAGDDHVLALTVHHIVSDGWSMGILVREVGTLYAAFSAGRPSPLPGLALQPADFAVWQRSWLHGVELGQCLGTLMLQFVQGELDFLLSSEQPRGSLPAGFLPFLPPGFKSCYLGSHGVVLPKLFLRPFQAGRDFLKLFTDTLLLGPAGPEDLHAVFHPGGDISPGHLQVLWRVHLAAHLAWGS